MRVRMTTRAIDYWQVILRRWFRFEIGRRLMAVAAGYRQMASTQTEGGFVVPGQTECRWPKPLEAVAIFAAV